MAGFVGLASADDSTQPGGLQPQWLSFGDRADGFSFDYPCKYRTQHPAAADMFALLKSLQPSWANEPDRGKASISVLFFKTAFNLAKLISEAPTGVIEPPAPVQFVGSHTFYYYGRGGGGVSYPEVYYFSLYGRTLKFVFESPYNGSKSPVEETKQIERQLLVSFKTF